MAVKKLKMYYKCIKLKTFLKIYRPPLTELFLRKLWCRILLCRELKEGKGRNGASGGSQKIKKKNLAYLYKLCQGRQRRQKQVFKLLSFTYY
jgi:hypothetical protein